MRLLEITGKRNTFGDEKQVRYYLPSGYYILEATKENSIAYIETYTQDTFLPIAKIVLNNKGDQYLLNWTGKCRLSIDSNHSMKVEAIK